MKNTILTLFLFLFSLTAFSVDELVIGCAYKCDPFYRRALFKAAKNNYVKIKILDLPANPQVRLSDVDGVLLPGGADISPEYYFPAIESSLIEYTKSLDNYVNYTEEGKRRDPFEFNLLKNYFNDDSLGDLPILGVCRGMQMLAVSQGIPLYVDIKKEFGIRNRRYLYDRVYVEDKESIMNQLFGNTFLAFKRHHQGMRVSYFQKHKDRWPNLEITSYSNNGVIAESLEFTDRPILAVQFHPENDFGYERKSIFGWLVKKAKERKFSK